MYTWEWSSLWQYREHFLSGMATTAWLSLLTIVFGTALAAVVAFARRSSNRALRLAAGIYLEIFRGIPLLVLLSWIYFALPTILDFRIIRQMPSFAFAVMALVLNLSAFAAENMRAGLEAVPDSQRESGLALGLSRWQTTWRIVLPQAIRNMLPNLMDQWITSVKLTSLASTIGVQELQNVSGQITSLTSRPLEVRTVCAVLYCMIIFLLSFLQRVCEKRLSQKGGVA